MKGPEQKTDVMWIHSCWANTWWIQLLVLIQTDGLQSLYFSPVAVILFFPRV